MVLPKIAHFYNRSVIVSLKSIPRILKFQCALTFDKNTVNIFSLDKMSLKHPTYFKSDYMDGYITLGGTGVVPTTCKINFENISPDGHLIELSPTMPYNSPQFEASLDMILNRPLLFLKEVIQDNMSCLSNSFTDEGDDAIFLYNSTTRLQLPLVRSTYDMIR